MKDWFSRGELSIKDVIEDIKILAIDGDRTSGLNPDNIDEFNKQKAKFFSENIINLERKDYSALATKQSQDSELNFVRGIHSLLEEDDYQLVTNWHVPKRIQLPDEKTLSEICRYSYVKRFLVKEISTLNSLLGLVQEDITTMKAIDSGRFAADPNFKNLKNGLLKGRLPVQWTDISRVSGRSFKDWKDLIKLRHHNLSKQAGLLERESKAFNLRWFADPKGLLEAIMLDAAYRRAPSTKFDDIIMTFKTTNIFERNLEQLPEEEYSVFGLKVKNAYVDKLKTELSDKWDANATEEFPAVLVQCKYIKRAGGEKGESKGYQCPVVSLLAADTTTAHEQPVLFKLVDLCDAASAYKRATAPTPAARQLSGNRITRWVHQIKKYPWSKKMRNCKLAKPC